jgi:hypothetical protein
LPIPYIGVFSVFIVHYLGRKPPILPIVSILSFAVAVKILRRLCNYGTGGCLPAALSLFWVNVFDAKPTLSPASKRTGCIIGMSFSQETKAKHIA